MRVSIPPSRLAPSRFTRISRVVGRLGSITLLFSSFLPLSRLRFLPLLVYDGSKTSLGTRLLLLDLCRCLERHAAPKTSLRGNIFSYIFFFYSSLSAAEEIGFYDFAVAWSYPRFRPFICPSGNSQMEYRPSRNKERADQSPVSHCLRFFVR